MEEIFYALSTDGGIVAMEGQSAGEAAIGVVLKDPTGCRVHQLSTRIGPVQDHHVAEYRALIAGLQLALGHGVSLVRACLDSALVVNQMNCDAKVRKEHLKPLWSEAQALKREFRDISIEWIPRKENTEADALAGRPLRELRRVGKRTN